MRDRRVDAQLNAQGRTEHTEGAVGMRQAGSTVARGVWLLVVGAAATVSWGAGAAAQATVAGGNVIAGDVVAVGDGRPLAYATIIVEPGMHQRFADAGGSFSVGPLPAGTYYLRVRQIGFAAHDTIVAVSDKSPTAPIRIALRVVALRLPPVTIVGAWPTACVSPGIPDSTVNPSLAGVFAELQKNVDRYRLLIDEYPFAFSREEWGVRRNGAGYEQTYKLDTVRYEVQEMESRQYTPGKVVVWDLGSNGGARHQYVPLPTFRYLGDSVFKSTHCFDYMGVDTAGGTEEIRVDFRPAAAIHTPDLEGSVYLDADRYIVRRAEFRITEPDRIVPPISELSVTTTFREIVPLVPLFDEVRYRQPTYKTGQAATMEVDRLLAFKFEHGAPGAHLQQ